MQQKFPRMSDGHAWKTSKLEKKLQKNQACLRTCVDFFLRKKSKLEKKNHVCSSYLSGIFFQLFFFWLKNIPQKSDEHGWVFFSQKKKVEKIFHQVR